MSQIDANYQFEWHKYHGAYIMTTHTIILIISIITSIITMVTFFITAHELDLVIIAHALLTAAVAGGAMFLYLTVGVAVLSWVGTQLGFTPKTNLVYLVILFILGGIGGSTKN